MFLSTKLYKMLGTNFRVVCTLDVVHGGAASCVRCGHTSDPPEVTVLLRPARLPRTRARVLLLELTGRDELDGWSSSPNLKQKLRN